MNKANEVIFSKDRYDNDRDKMYQAIAKQLALLMENDYVCKVYDDDIDIVVIQYEHDEKKDYWGGMELCWLTQEQIEELERFKPEQEDDGIDDCGLDTSDESDDGNNTTCHCYHTEYGRPQCWGTRERDYCKCGGDESKCDFYPEKRNNTK